MAKRYEPMPKAWWRFFTVMTGGALLLGLLVQLFGATG